MSANTDSSAEKFPPNRREFLINVAGFGVAAGTASLLAACAPVRMTAPASNAPARPAAAPAAAPPSTALARQARVAFVKTTDRAVGVRQAMALLDPSGLAGKNILLKPNFNSADPAPGSTHLDVLRTLVEELRARNAGALTLADRSGMGNTRQVMEQLGVFELAKALGVATIVLDELDAAGWSLIQPADSHWQQGFPFANCCLAADAVVQACCLKTHSYGGHFTLSLKNSVGLVGKQIPGDSHNYMNELHTSPHQRRLIAEINTAYAPALIVMDGVEAFVEGGPGQGKRVAAEVVLAATDRVAIDAVGVALLRYFGTTPAVSEGAIFAQEQIARAVELKLGIESPERIELVTADADSEAYAAQIRAILQRESKSAMIAVAGKS